MTLSEVINLGIEPRRVWDYDEFKVLVLDEGDFTRVRDSHCNPASWLRPWDLTAPWMPHPAAA